MNDDLGREVARMDGRVSALEGRFDRHENTMVGRLTGIESKIDRLSDNIAASKGGATLLRWLIGCGAAVLAAVASHFWEAPK